ncbi:MAG TPA: sugar phosphate nucleotidyltransferase, partial [Tepidisphaeraceae bacterium]|nr:sugar phosphate nucleotidyltransferase [Tepidisphaeraceae bacterium]
MRYALIIAGGSGTRLWPMSRHNLPKQLIPFVQGRSLLQIAFERLEGLVAAPQRYICAGNAHAQAVRDAIPALNPT